MSDFAFTEQAWLYALSQIEKYGSEVITEDRQLIKEILGLELSINDPLAHFPIKGSNWDLPALNEYANDLCNFSYDLKGFDYNYCERMGRQVYYAIEHLRKYPTTRRATLFLWLPEKDLETDQHHPCQIMADYKLRDDKLYAFHVFRSHDLRDAYVPNVYGLAKLQQQMSEELEVKPGPLTTYSISAHYYIERLH